MPLQRHLAAPLDCSEPKAAEVAEGDDKEDVEAAKAADQDQHAPTSAAPPMT